MTFTTSNFVQSGDNNSNAIIIQALSSQVYQMMQKPEEL